MKRQEVIGKCVEMGVPIFHGRIDKSLFETSLRSRSRAAGSRGDAAAELSAELDSPAMGRGTKSKTLADLLPLAAQTVRRRARGPLQGRRAVGRPQLRRGRGDRPPARPRPDRARGRQGRQGLDPRQHPPRVDLLRLRGALDRRHRGPDLPDQLARGVPLRARELRRQGRRRRGRRTAGEDPRGPRPAAAARAGGADDRRQRRRDLDRRPGRQGRRRRRRPTGRRATRRSPRPTSAPSSTPRAPPARRRAA